MYIATVNSTNDYLRLHPDIVTLRTDFQTSGRGQAGNHWESEQGQNLLFSTRLKEIGLAATDQWFINMLVAVALYETLNTKLSTLNSTLTIKWPNDLYYGDKKLAGVLIENTLLGTHIADSIIGIGLNLNQTEWHSDAPNPVSLKQITGEDYDPDEIMNMFLTTLAQLMPNMNRIRSDYMQHLYRREGFYWWEEREVSTMPTMNGTRTEQSFEAQIVDITPQGELVLQTRNQEIKTYHFKQIKYIL
ncbi:MAG: biotin--[acetyl-CoA-carboxylase] ligase [Bacteroidales bacterium]|nr:biotin--[acetyl-CoA-carboxylase] ligase [Candidatus Colicola equi]